MADTRESLLAEIQKMEAYLQDIEDAYTVAEGDAAAGFTDAIQSLDHEYMIIEREIVGLNERLENLDRDYGAADDGIIEELVTNIFGGFDQNLDTRDGSMYDVLTKSVKHELRRLEEGR